MLGPIGTTDLQNIATFIAHFLAQCAGRRRIWRTYVDVSRMSRQVEPHCLATLPGRAEHTWQRRQVQLKPYTEEQRA